jgi:hypothetical protein
VRPPQRHMIMIIAALLGGIAGADPAGAASNLVSVQANLSKPLTLEWVQDLNLGSITLGPGTWSGATVSISRAGAFSCTNANVTCTGAAQVATYNVTGNNGQVVRITAPNVTLVNQNDPNQTLTLVVDRPVSITLTNSGKPGQNFSIGGSITVSSSTASGTYSGTFDVTVDN